MEKCKFCQAELEETSTVCPVCGKDNAPEEEIVTPVTEAEAAAPVQEDTASQEAVTGEVTEPPPESAQAEDNGEAAPVAEGNPNIGKPGIQATPGKIALAVAAVVVLLAILVALVVYGIGGLRDEKQDAVPTETDVITEVPEATVETTPATVPADGNPDDVTCKGTYTVTDEEVLAARDAVVATVDGKELTNGVLQVYYWRAVQDFLSNYGAYAPYFGMDYTKPLDTQPALEENMTWQQYFLMVGLNTWHEVQSMGLEAENAGVGISKEDQAYLDGTLESLETTASQYDVTVEELLHSNFGPGANFDDYMRYQTDYCLGVPYYYTQCDLLVPTEKDLEDFFTAHEEEYGSNDITRDGLLVDVRHILIMPEGGTTGEDGSTTYSEEEWKACQDKAEEILSQWKSGDMTEESFAQLAEEHSTDGGSNRNGGLYENVFEGQMVPEFNDWCFDSSRKEGDTGVVKTTFGCHVMYYAGNHPQWRYYAEQDWMTEQTTTLRENMVKRHPIQVSYDKIVLGLAPLN